MDTKDIVEFGKEVIKLQSESIKNLVDLIDENFEAAIKLILDSKGRVVVTGIGKSAIIANKIVATLNSTGTPAIFMHAADAIHGDLGIIKKDDVIICISKSGNTPEIKDLVPFLNMNNNPLISITGDVNSFLARNSAVVLSSYVDIEVCPNNLAPTNSTTAQLVIGDALAVTLVKIKGFTSNDFAKFHPGGSLGKKLFLKVKDIVDTDLKPMVAENDNIKDVIIEISNKMLGITPVLSKNSIVGVITDGDLRRTLLNNQEISGLVASDIMSINPQIIDFEIKALDALKIMKNNKISQLIVTKDNKYYGVLHIQNIIKEGIS
ncbi:MAG: D-arabinose 5-phosphate isomerase [Flavobacteriaceae bacterium]|nr:D-arabinose 5-phosphate isomerase [Flavobacteriaceae bacterium]OUV84907.1 MAG: D-arabinose 5-phosphate isomerase [Flavobacteriaceae bacterium TMED145]